MPGFNDQNGLQVNQALLDYLQQNTQDWITSTCRVIPGFKTETRNMGTPDGTSAGQNSGFIRVFGGMQVSLYDCGS